MLERINGIRAGYVRIPLQASSIGLLLILLAALSQKLLADGISYRYVEFGGHLGQSVGANNRGIGFDGSYDLSDQVFVTAGFLATDIETEIQSGAEFYRLGAGLRTGIFDSLDGVLMVDYAKLDVDIQLRNGGNAGVDASGAMIDAGVRGRVGRSWEYTALATYVDWANRGFGYRVGGLCHLGQSRFSLGLHSAHFEGAWDRLELALRYRFD